MKFFSVVFCLLWIFPAIAGPMVSLPEEVYNQLAPGDIIIRKGGGPLSYQLMEISGENYSHCAVVVKQNNRWWVIESQAAENNSGIDGVQINPLEKFIKYTADSMLFICRPVIDSMRNNQIAERAFFYLEKKIPFDHRFDLLNPDRFYCSELLLHIFNDVFGQYIFEIRQQHKTFVPLFATFFNRSKFRPIYTLRP